MKKEKNLIKLTGKVIESMIYVIRGQKVMLDFDLAKLYGYETKKFNERVNDNIKRFDSDFRFRLSNKEWENILRSEIRTAKLNKIRFVPHAFTEQGIYMLMTVLKSELAVEQSKTLIRTFKKMKDYIIENRNVLDCSNYLQLSKIVESNTNKINKLEEKIDVVMDNFVDPNTYKHYLILNGEKIEANIAYGSIYKLANKSIYIIDNYINIKTLQLIKSCKSDVDIVIFTDNKSKNKININNVNDFINETKNNITIKSSNNRFHDRYVILDFNTNNEAIYLCGSSSKDSGNKITTIVKLEHTEQYHKLINEILNNENLKLD